MLFYSKDIKDIKLDSIKYRIFNCNFCFYEQFDHSPFALNCCRTMFNINGLQNIRNYKEGKNLEKHLLE